MDVNVTIGLETQATPRETMLTLIVSNEGEHDYAEYTGLDALAPDYADTTATYRAAKALLAQDNPEGRPYKFAVIGLADTATATEIVDALDAARNSHDDFYFVRVTSTDEAINTAVANWAAATVLDMQTIKTGALDDEKLFFAESRSKEARLTAAQSVLCYNPDTASDMPSAWIGRVSPYYPDNADWRYKALTGVPVPPITGEESVALDKANVNTYVTRNGEDYMIGGKCADGQYIDVVISRAKIKRAIKRYVTRVYKANKIVPYDDDGFVLIGQAVIAALDEAVDNGDILTLDDVPQYTIQLPRRIEATSEQAAARIMPPIYWRATLRGAVQDVDIYGVLTIELPQ